MAIKKSGRKNLNRMMQTGPFVAIAVIAERVLMEEGNHVPSLIRIVDRLLLPKEAVPFPKEGDNLAIPLTAFFGIRGGKFSGECEMSLYQISPLGERDQAGDPVKLEFPRDTPDAGFNFQVPVILKWHGEGQYWFEVQLDKIPFCHVSLYVAIGKFPPTKKATFQATKEQKS